MIKSFEDLEVWKLGVEIVRNVYLLVASFPKEEIFGITSQLKDSVISNPGNIAEGFGRFHYKDKIKFYYNSRGSLLETKSHLLIANALGFITPKYRELYNKILADIEKEAVKLNNYIASVGRSGIITNNHK